MGVSLQSKREVLFPEMCFLFTQRWARVSRWWKSVKNPIKNLMVQR